MIEPKDLRIGNYYIDICGQINRWQIEYYIFYLHHPLNSHNYYDKINPIPLTSQILKDSGFEEHRPKNGQTLYSYWPILIILDEGDKVQDIFLYEDSITITDIKWLKKPECVHQLQNLYFWLRGEELEIKINAQL